MENDYPIQYLSFSSLKNYLSNQAGWYRSYVLNERTNELSPAALVGRTIHKYMELHYRLLPVATCREITIAFFNEQARTVTDWGKTGNKTKSKNEVMCAIRDLLRAVDKKKLSGPKAAIVNIEEPMEAPVGFSIPLKAIPDLIIRKKDGLHIWDWKKCSAFNKKPSALYYMQAVFNAMLAREKYKEDVIDVTFVEIKPLKNEGPLKKAVNLVVVKMDWESLQLIAVKRLINFMLEDISGIKRHYLPNVTDLYSSEESWMAWLEETSDDTNYHL